MLFLYIYNWYFRLILLIDRRIINMFAYLNHYFSHDLSFLSVMWCYLIIILNCYFRNIIFTWWISWRFQNYFFFWNTQKTWLLVFHKHCSTIQFFIFVVLNFNNFWRYLFFCLLINYTSLYTLCKNLIFIINNRFLTLKYWLNILHNFDFWGRLKHLW